MCGRCVSIWQPHSVMEHRLSARCVSLGPVNSVADSSWGILTCAQMSRNAIAHRDCKNTVRECTERVSSQRGGGAGGFPCCTRGVERASADQLSYSHVPDHFSCHNDQKSVVLLFCFCSFGSCLD